MNKIITKEGLGTDPWLGHEIPIMEDYQGGATVEIVAGHDVNTLLPYIDQLELIVLIFASSADGRGFSQAALLRDFGYIGHIRARGHILVDQWRAARRSGVDDLEISQEQFDRNPEHQWQNVPHDSDYRSKLFIQGVDA